MLHSGIVERINRSISFLLNNHSLHTFRFFSLKVTVIGSCLDALKRRNSSFFTFFKENFSINASETLSSFSPVVRLKMKEYFIFLDSLPGGLQN